MFQGSIVALVTPMHADGSLALKEFSALIEQHMHAKTSAILVAGTTGESATLEEREYSLLLSTAVKQAAKQVPILAGAGTNSTKTTLKLIEQAKAAGVDACLTVTPYYNKPTQQGLYEHYQLIARHSPLPIILYNVPSRTACDLLPDTVEQLSKISNIIGIKEATGELARAKEILQRCGQPFAVYSGEDKTAFELMTEGAHGVISVTANVVPQKMHAFCEAARKGQWESAHLINHALLPLHRALFVQSNPIPVKWALHFLQQIPEGIRLPLTCLEAQYHPFVKEALRLAGVIR